MRSVLSLVFTFFNIAAIWLLLEAEFLAIVLVLVYVGAVMVLFLFVVMMIDMESPDRSGFWFCEVLAFRGTCWWCFVGYFSDGARSAHRIEYDI